MAYPAKNKEYGVIALDINDSANYSFYQIAKQAQDDYLQKLKDYNTKVRAFNAEIKGKVYYIGTANWFEILLSKSLLKTEWQHLDQLEAKLIDIWEPLGIVSTIEIYW